MRNWLLYFFAFALVTVAMPFAAERVMGEGERYFVTVSGGEGVAELPLEEYVLRVLSAEGAGCSEEESKKALAVALRSIARYASLKGLNHTDFDFCTDTECCFALTEPERVDDAARHAVEETQGEILSHESLPAFTPFCLCSGSGTTVNSSYSYLSAVAEDSACEIHRREYELPYGALFPEGDKGVLVYDEHKKCVFGVIGGQYVDAKRIMRECLLDSAEFELSFGEKSVKATVYGVGNGLGMNLCGADAMAKKGSDYKQILEKYFPLLTLS